MSPRIEVPNDENTAVLWVSCPDLEGRDVECSALARTVRWHIDDRVFLCHSRCIGFA